METQNTELHPVLVLCNHGHWDCLYPAPNESLRYRLVKDHSYRGVLSQCATLLGYLHCFITEIHSVSSDIHVDAATSDAKLVPGYGTNGFCYSHQHVRTCVRSEMGKLGSHVRMDHVVD